MIYLIAATIEEVLGSQPVRVAPITPKLAQMILQDQGFLSAVADKKLAEAFSASLGIKIPVNTDPVQINWGEDEVMIGKILPDGNVSWVSLMLTE